MKLIIERSDNELFIYKETEDKFKKMKRGGLLSCKDFLEECKEEALITPTGIDFTVAFSIKNEDLR